MMRLNQYPSDIDLETAKENNLKTHSKNEIQIESGENKENSLQKLYRITVSLKESLINPADDSDEDDILREFSMKIFYYVDLKLEELTKKEEKQLIVFILQDIDDLIGKQTTMDNKNKMSINGSIGKYKSDNNISEEKLLEIII